jgi:large subunit ribosomal protein L29
MKYTDVKDMSVTELKKKKTTLTQDIFDMKIKNQLGQLSNPIQIRDLRKDLARVNTALVQVVAR